MIAYPAEYRSSGVMTFIVTDRSVVYEKDLGRNFVYRNFHDSVSQRWDLANGR